MTDTKRLATDAAYWDEIARDSGCVSPGTPPTICGIPRPTKPAAPEWDGELPPVGSTENECAIRGLSKADSFEVIAHRDGKAIVYFRAYPVSVTTFAPDEFRPIRTKEQRQKDELADLIENHQMENGSFCTPENTADAILSRYNLEPKL